jgi:hypothetical protein
MVFTVPAVADVAVVDGGPVAAEVSAFHTTNVGAAIIVSFPGFSVQWQSPTAQKFFGENSFGTTGPNVV